MARERNRGTTITRGNTGVQFDPHHLISIAVTNTSVNPARSTGPAIFVGGWALSQLWLFWLAPIIGAFSAGWTYVWLGEESLASKIPVVGDRHAKWKSSIIQSYFPYRGYEPTNQVIQTFNFLTAGDTK